MLFAAPFMLRAQVVFELSEEAVIERLKEDIHTLASEEMEGREAGTQGERKAAAYLKERMAEMGLQPLFDGSFYQEFPFPGHWVRGNDNTLAFKEREFVHGEDYVVLPGSASGYVQAPAVHVGYGLSITEGVPGFESWCDYALLGDIGGRFFIMEFYLPELLDTLADVSPFLVVQQKIRLAAERGAAGVIFVNTGGSRPDPPADLRISRQAFDLPVLFAGYEVLHHLMTDHHAQLSLNTDLYREDHTGINVAGYIDNQAATTVVIGGHYDHVGYGAQGSRSPGSNAVHYGADDNASGTAGVLEMARHIANSSLDRNNYLFIAFSAEEKGLIGSRYFTESDAYDMSRVNYMFNLDMIGRLENETLTMIGTGSSPVWDGLIDTFAPAHFAVRKNPGGRGGSDHTSFYLKEIPVLFFFTGVHDDYHRPEDTPDKINYPGAAEIISFALDLAEELDAGERVPFSTSPAPAAGRTRAAGPSLGLMPDHGFDGEGLRVMSVSGNGPARAAGLLDGDVIVRIDSRQVMEIGSYMEALSGLRPGSRVIVVVVREGEEVSLEVAL